jgi:hypothetical protein
MSDYHRGLEFEGSHKPLLTDTSGIVIILARTFPTSRRRRIGDFLLLFIEPSVIKILQPRKTGRHRLLPKNAEPYW